MILKATKNTKENKRFKVYDYLGKEISGILKYDTKSCKAVMILHNKSGKVLMKKNGILVVTVVLEDSYATIDGKKIED